VETVPRYTLKADPFSSHSAILGWLPSGQGRRLLDVGAADGLLSRHLTERGWKVTGIEADPAMAAAGAAHCERMLAADLNRGVPALDGLFDAIVCGERRVTWDDFEERAARLASHLQPVAPPQRGLRGRVVPRRVAEDRGVVRDQRDQQSPRRDLPDRNDEPVEIRSDEPAEIPSPHNFRDWRDLPCLLIAQPLQL